MLYFAKEKPKRPLFIVEGVGGGGSWKISEEGEEGEVLTGP